MTVLQAERERKKRCDMTMPMVRRAQQLLDARLSMQATLIVLELDFGTAPAAETLRKYVTTSGRKNRIGLTSGGRENFRGRQQVFGRPFTSETA